MKKRTKDDYKIANSKRVSILNSKRSAPRKKIIIGELGKGAGAHLVGKRLTQSSLAEMTAEELAAKLGWSKQNG